MKNPQAKTSWKIKRFRRELVSYTSLVDIGALNSQSETCAHPSVHVCFSILIPFRDWCANPGKRKRRRHRKSRYSESTVGFVELSRMVAARWAELDTVDPETFNFVHELAAEKRREMDQHNRMIAASGSNALFENKMYRKKSQVGSKRRPGSSSSMRTRTNKSFTKNKLPFYKNTEKMHLGISGADAKAELGDNAGFGPSSVRRRESEKDSLFETKSSRSFERHGRHPRQRHPTDVASFFHY